MEPTLADLRVIIGGMNAYGPEMPAGRLELDTFRCP